MNTHLRFRFGEEISNPTKNDIERAIAELAIEDDEHPDIAFRNEEEWDLCAFPAGKVILENLEEGDPRFMKGISTEKLKDLWKLIALGNIDDLLKEPWAPGYGNE